MIMVQEYSEYGSSILLPTGYDVAWSVLPILFLMSIVAVVIFAERSRGARGLNIAVWCLLVVALPGIGILIWLVHLILQPVRAKAEPVIH